MRKNEYTSLDQFTSQYVGEWNPSEGHWLGLDFIWNGNEYRFQTGSMYNPNNTILPDGREAVFGLYKKTSAGDDNKREYELLGEYANMQDVLQSCVIGGIPFAKVIIDEGTELIGQD
ncbi:MAG: hypothetical protein IKF90_24850 [Parasporobacterium sp.]|nr:hypothetical protein [Parasporobacterium sp.]